MTERDRTQATTWTVGRVADEFGITVRTLHHYDEIGLLHPSGRGHNGYRRYEEADLIRLRTIVVYRRLGFTLGEVAELLADDADVIGHLQRQRQTVSDQLDELRWLVQAIDIALEKEMNLQPITNDEMRALFGTTYDDYRRDAEATWGESDQWQQADRRTRMYAKTDWQQLRAEAQAIERRMVEVFHAGEASHSASAMDVAERHRLHVDQWFYDCPPAFHRQLGDLYVNDPSYVAAYDETESADAAALARWIHDAIDANATRQAGT